MKINVLETAIAVAPGKTNDLKVSVKRLHGFKAKLALSVKETPGDLTSETVDIPEKGGEVTLKLMASSEAKPFNGPIRVVAVEQDSRKAYRALTDLTSSTVNNGVPGGFTKLAIESTDQIWLTVLPAVPLPEKNAEKSK